MAQQAGVNDLVPAGGAVNAVGGEEQAALGKRMSGEVQKRYGPRQACKFGLAVAAEDQGRAQHGDRNRGVFRRREAQQRAPIFLLERVERGEDGAEHGNNDDEYAEAGGDARLLVGQPFQQAAAQTVERGIEHHARHQRAGSAAAGAVRAREPFVERKQAQLGAKANDQQNADEHQCRRRQFAGRRAELGESERMRRGRQQENRGHERDRADFQQAQHEQDRAADLGGQLLAEDHDGAAEAHDLPRNQKTRTVANPKNPKRSNQAHCRAEQPAGLAQTRRRRQCAGEGRRNEPEAEEPGAVGAQLKENRRPGEVSRQPCRGRSTGQRQDGRANSGKAANAQQDASNGGRAAGERDECGGEPESKRGDQELIRQAGLP